MPIFEIGATFESYHNIKVKARTESEAKKKIENLLHNDIIEQHLNSFGALLSVDEIERVKA